MRIFQKEAPVKDEIRKSNGKTTSEAEILELIDARINELMEKGLIKKP